VLGFTGQKSGWVLGRCSRYPGGHGRRRLPALLAPRIKTFSSWSQARDLFLEKVDYRRTHFLSPNPRELAVLRPGWNFAF
jgi:hypothetical protein